MGQTHSLYSPGHSHLPRSSSQAAGPRCPPSSLRSSSEGWASWRGNSLERPERVLELQQWSSVLILEDEQDPEWGERGEDKGRMEQG